MHRVPSSHLIDGEQHIAVQSGWGVDAERLLGAINAVFDTKTMVPQGGALLVYQRKKQARAGRNAPPLRISVAAVRVALPHRLL